jgi:hypothetical protein
MDRYEIYYAKRAWHNCVDERPWLIVELRDPGVVGCLPISGAWYGDKKFVIEDSHPDFAATGLKKTSFVDDTYIIEVSINDVRRHLGQLTGSLLEDFQIFSGL